MEAENEVQEEEVPATVYEAGVWQRGKQDWCWKLAADGRRDEGGILAHGSGASSRKRAKEAAQEALRQYLAEQAAKWGEIEP